MWTSYLDWGLADFSGYIAVDELYDGPFCVLSIVDNHTFKRLLYQVLDHAPDHQDITAFFRRFRLALQLRGLAVRGVTTDGAPLYPEPLRAVFGEVPHQICEFHILKELTKAILRAVAQERKTLAARLPTLKRGRPSTSAAKRAVRQRARTQQKIGALFAQRYLFVQHDLTPTERRTLQHITRGLPQLRTLRAIMEEVYRVFDRRCRTDTALAKLAKLRQRVRRDKHLGNLLTKLRSPHLEKALTFLDDTLLPSTSNAVERGNRRHRKMQKTVYRVRTQGHLTHRIALDMLRDAQKESRTNTLEILHRRRAGQTSR
jgi:Transposase